MLLPVRRGVLTRIAPFLLFITLLAVRASLPSDAVIDPRWVYGIGVIVVSAALWWFRADYGELSAQLRPDAREVALAAGVGLVVFACWISLDAPWMRIGQPLASFRPVDAAGGLDWPLVAVRWIGAALLVPVMEEIFWRSFLMRWIDQPSFETVVPQRVSPKAVVLSTFVFTLAHTLWLAAVIAGLAYAWLYVRTGKLWVPIVAHAVTNGVLGVWVVTTGNWSFW